MAFPIPADRVADSAVLLLLFAPLIVVPLRAFIDPAPALAVLQQISSELDHLNPPWMRRASPSDVLRDTPGSRAGVRLLSSLIMVFAFIRLAEQLSKLVR